MFIGRYDELAFLEEKYNSADAQLIVLYGRRRVGKTETLRKFCEHKPHVFYACTESTDELQLASFSQRLLEQDLPAAKYIKRFADWSQALSAITELPSQQKKILVIDEFPYMVKGNTSIPSILQNLWDESLRQANIMIVLCGSSMSFIEKEILSEKNPLYGRATGILKMNELPFSDAIQFVPSYTDIDKISTYAVLGGIPHYLKQFDISIPLAENIQRNILTRGSILYSEVEFLMRQELRETAVYNVIIQAIALGSTKLNEIHQKTGIDKNKLSVYIKNLTDLNILTREFSMADGVKEYSNTQRGLYKITDNFFKFWYAFVFPNSSELESGDALGIWRHVVSPTLDEYTSRIFEDVCIQYLRKQNRSEKLPFYFTKIGRWWDKNSEIDILATDTHKQNFIIGECKYRNTKFSLADYRALQAKFTPHTPDANVHYYLFSKSGFSAELVKVAKQDKVELIGVKELFG